jgi:hypothetical protein
VFWRRWREVLGRSGSAVRLERVAAVRVREGRETRD